MRKKIIAGNWKMYKTSSESTAYFSEFIKSATKCKFLEKTVVLFPPFLSLELAASRAKGISESLSVGSQNMHQAEEGAFTGEVSAKMIKDIGAEYVLLGHSERRQYFAENDEAIANKLRSAVDASLTPVICVGEDQGQRENGRHKEVVSIQIKEGLKNLSSEEIKSVIIAYEPVWAIGTGLTASPEEAQEMHAFIRTLMGELANEDIASKVPILYGGSVKPQNAAELFSQQDIDGALVGGASLEVESFIEIINAMP